MTYVMTHVTRVAISTSGCGLSGELVAGKSEWHLFSCSHTLAGLIQRVDCACFTCLWQLQGPFGNCPAHTGHPWLYVQLSRLPGW